MDIIHRFVEADGVRFHVATAGTGAPVVLLHGQPQHWYAWRKVVAELAADYQLFCIDLRGCGESEATSGGYSTKELARDVLAVMDALGLGQAYLIGHEGGGWLGFELCLTAPDRFTAFLAVNTSHPWPAPAELIRGAWRFWYTALWEYPLAGRAVLRRWPGVTRFLLRRWAGRSYRWDEAALAEFVQSSRTKGQSRAIEQLLWQFVLHDIPALVTGSYRRRHLTVPTLILGGEKDPVTRPPRPVASVRVEIVPGWHLLPETAPRLVAAATREHFG
jgi:pimeloyl-ACP methyl ester carboxylesterase